MFFSLIACCVELNAADQECSVAQMVASGEMLVNKSAAACDAGPLLIPAEDKADDGVGINSGKTLTSILPTKVRKVKPHERLAKNLASADKPVSSFLTTIQEVDEDESSDEDFKK